MGTSLCCLPLCALLAGPALAFQGFGEEQQLAFPASYAIRCMAADLDGDGDPDFATAGHTRTAWFENRGPLGFRQAQVLEQLPTGITVNGVLCLAGGDLDGDGDIDLVTGNLLTKQVVWFRNLGAGVYAPAEILATNVSSPQDVAIDDLDGDGDLDVLFVSSVTESLVLCRNLGGGAFAPAAVQAALGDFVVAIDVGDVDGDGDLDAVVGGFSRVALLLNDGTGHFAAPSVVEAAALDCRGLELVDLDGDLDLDLAATSISGATVAWYRNQSGVYQPKQVLATGLQTAEVVRSSDVDADGDSDLLVGDYSFASESSLRLLLNDGSGGFSAPVLLATQMDVLQGLSVADLDGNGTPDLLSATRGDGRIGWHSNLGSGNFSARVELTAGLNESRQILALDIDSDGDRDVLAREEGSNEVLWYENQSLQGFARGATLVTAPATLREFAALDADLDGDQDLALAGPFGLILRKNDGTGQFTAQVVLAGASSNGWGVAAGDLDGDGEVDLSFSYGAAGGGIGGPSKIGVLINRGGGLFPPLKEVANSTGGDQLQIEDLTGTDLPEILYVLGYLQTPTYLENLGTQGFSAPIGVPGSLLGGGTVRPTDLDGDLDNDLLVADSFGVRYFRNQAGSFAPSTSLISGAHQAASSADLDGDGIADLVVSGQSGVRWARGLGGASFAPPATIETDFLSGFRLAIADLDADGGLDVVATDFSAHRLSWFKNLLSGDCDHNGAVDAVEIAAGSALDCDGNGVPDSCDLLQPGADIDLDGQLDACVAPALSASSLELSVAGGGAQRLALQGPAGAIYLVAGSLSGTSPGTPFGGAVIPLQFDGYTLLSLDLANQAPFTETLGVFDGLGTADAVITLPAGSVPALAGLQLHHAFVALTPGVGVSLVSNPVPLALLP